MNQLSQGAYKIVADLVTSARNGNINLPISVIENLEKQLADYEMMHLCRVCNDLHCEKHEGVDDEPFCE